MTIAMVTAVANEIEMIDGFISHHRTLGVDHFVFTDVVSTDGSRERLLEHGEADDVTVLLSPVDYAPDGFEWRTEMLRVATEDVGVDRVMRIDVDERLVRPGGVAGWPTGELAVTASRFNAVFPDPASAVATGRDELPAHAAPAALVTRAPDPGSRMDPDMLPWVLTPVAGRTVAPTRSGMASTPGGHHVLYGDEVAPTAPATGELAALVLHLPFTTWNRFRRKVDSAVRLIDRMKRDMGSGAGWHWQRWVSLLERGEDALRAEFEAQFMLPEEAAARLGQACVAPASRGIALLAAR